MFAVISIVTWKVNRLFSSSGHIREFTDVSMCRTMLPLPVPDDAGRRIILMRTGITDPDKVKIADVFKAQMMVADILLEEDDRISICGTMNVMDHSKATLTHMAQFSPSLTKKASTLFQVKIAESTCSPSEKYCFCFKLFEAKDYS